MEGKEIILTDLEIQLIIDGLVYRYSQANDVGKRAVANLQTRLYELKHKKDAPAQEDVGITLKKDEYYCFFCKEKLKGDIEESSKHLLNHIEEKEKEAAGEHYETFSCPYCGGHLQEDQIYDDGIYACINKDCLYRFRIKIFLDEPKKEE